MLNKIWSFRLIRAICCLFVMSLLTIAPLSTAPVKGSSSAAPNTQNQSQMQVCHQNLCFLVDRSLASHVRAETYAPESGYGLAPWPIPAEHTQFIFEGYPVQGVDFVQPTIYVLPVSEFSSQADSLRSLLAERRDLSATFPFYLPEVRSGRTLPFLPTLNAGAVVAANMKYLTFSNGAGISYVTAFAQAVVPLSISDIFYTFQGLTNDGQYYIAAVFPLYPHLSAGMPPFPDTDDVDEIDRYNQSLAFKLEQATDEDYRPSLDLLDQVVSSITTQRSAPPTQPPVGSVDHDEVQNARLIPTLPANGQPWREIGIDTTRATTDRSEPSMSCGDQINSNTVWYRFRPSFSGVVEFETLGSNYDTVLAVFADTPDPLNEVICNDDANQSYQSKVVFSVEAGRTYYIAVADYNAEPSGGLLTLSVKRQNATATPRPISTPTPTSCPSQYRAEYYNNRTLSGQPTFVRCEEWPISHNWSANGPGNGISSNNFSVRWTGRATMEAGPYVFIYRSDEGMRVWLNDQLIINDWHNPPYSERRVIYHLRGGEYEIKVEYYNSWGAGAAHFRWGRP